MKIYKYGFDGIYSGEEESPDGSLSHNSTTIEPEITEGFWPVWDDGTWLLTEDHRGKKGFIGKEETEIKDLGPLPEGFADAPPPPTLEEAKAAKLAEIAAARFKEETGGTVFQGMSIDTARESQALITGAALQATVDSAYSCRWKTSAGFVELTAAQILAVAVAVRAHVQACFDREAELIPQVGAAPTVAEVEKIAWPVQP
jgi:hypothetical protein